jgi:hypothetical protein
MLFNPHLSPPGGFEFIDPEGVRHVGDNANHLAAKLAEYRIRRGLPPGNPVAEIHGDLCQRFPGYCQGGPKPASEKPPATQPLDPLTTQIGRWLLGVHREAAAKAAKYVPEEEAARRAAICAKCPEQAPLPAKCVSCAETMNQVSFQLRAGRDKSSRKLAACSRFGTDLRVDALLEQPAAANAPENCWKNPNLY